MGMGTLQGQSPSPRGPELGLPSAGKRLFPFWKNILGEVSEISEEIPQGRKPLSLF